MSGAPESNIAAISSRSGSSGGIVTLLAAVALLAGLALAAGWSFRANARRWELPEGVALSTSAPEAELKAQQSRYQRFQMLDSGINHAILGGLVGLGIGAGWLLRFPASRPIGLIAALLVVPALAFAGGAGGYLIQQELMSQGLNKLEYSPLLWLALAAPMFLGLAIAERAGGLRSGPGLTGGLLASLAAALLVPIVGAVAFPIGFTVESVPRDGTVRFVIPLILASAGALCLLRPSRSSSVSS